MQQHVKKVAAACVQLPRTATVRRRVGPEVTTQLVYWHSSHLDLTTAIQFLGDRL